MTSPDLPADPEDLLDRIDDAEVMPEPPAPVAQLREGIRPGSGLWFYDCPACPCDFGTMGSREKAEREASEHDAEHHATPATEAAS